MRGPLSITRHINTLFSAVLTLLRAPISKVARQAMDRRVAARCEVAIAGRLIGLRRSLITIGCGLIALGCGLIALGRGLIGIRCRLVGIRAGLITVGECLIGLDCSRVGPIGTIA